MKNSEVIFEFKTGKGEFLLCKAPSNATNFTPYCGPSGNMDCLSFETDEWVDLGFVEIGCEFKIIGLVSELTEEQWREVVDRKWVDGYVGGENADPLQTLKLSPPRYKYLDSSTKSYAFDTATASGFSLLNSLEVYSKNPYGEEPKTHPIEYYKAKYCPNGAEDEYRFDWERHREWEKHQERTGSWLLLKKN